MVRSEIFEEYAKIALEQGLITLAEKGPRRGSDDISTVEALYGIKPNGKDEKPLTEQAHPESVIIAPSYDRLNGLVENNQERQDIMIGIITKAPQAKLTQHRYAQTRADLANELVALGFYLENQNEENLTVLADSCAERITKIALVPALLVGAAVLVGLLGVYNNFGDISQGVRADCQKVSTMLTEMIAGSDYDAHDDELDFMLKNVHFILDICDRIEALKAGLPSANLSGAVALQESDKAAQMEKLLKYFLKNCRLLAREIPAYVNILKSFDSNPNQEAEANWMSALRSMYRKLDPTDANDLVQALESLGKSLAAAPQTADAIRAQYHQAAEFKQRKLISDQDGDEVEEIEPKADVTKPKATDQISDLTQVLKDL